MSSMTSNIKILLDSDVIRHLIKGDRLSLLPDLYGNQLVLLDVVRDELFRSIQVQTVIENFIRFYKIEVRDFPTNNIDILKEFALLKKRYGLGESACMAVAKFEKNIIASSNLKDIKKYCVLNNIKYITTMDILLEAVNEAKISEKECNHT